jgi:hypothetical protein
MDRAIPDRKAMAIKTPYVCSENGPMRNKTGYMTILVGAVSRNGAMEQETTGVME